jgi:hypothetical protein
MLLREEHKPRRIDACGECGFLIGELQRISNYFTVAHEVFGIGEIENLVFGVKIITIQLFDGWIKEDLQVGTGLGRIGECENFILGGDIKGIPIG